ncbi:PD-(D/E)XK nuclease domain-containing protein [Diplocloster agilis]|uniref:PD-(D/E)XK nuclease domain-containing protein n=1 Tax=Diplocloster agilis TaxID=2850323 RepID=A0A949NIC2_9FIRM|nr:PD-(D/E)XK nuclease domain-containing protein [Diplocloster agilis]
MSGLQKQLQKFLLQTISSHDAASESFYHGMVIGLCAIMNNMYYVSSNRESGAGRYDVQLLPHNKVLPGILIELKVLRETVPETEISERLKKLCHAALQQIETKNYAVSMREQGVQQIMKFGIAFYKKRVEIVCRMGDEPGRKD